MTDHEANLHNAIENLYSVFADYRLAWFDGPYCCTSEGDEKTLHSKPLRELTGEDLQLTEWHYFLCGRKDVEGYKHLLPRLFEVLSAGQWTYPVEPLMRGLHDAGFLGWPPEEKTPVIDYLVWIWRMILSDPQYGIDAEEWLVSLAIAGVDVPPLLEMWQKDTSLEAAYRLAEMAWGTDGLANRKLDGPYWEDHPDVMKTVVTWLLDGSVLEMLQPERFEGHNQVLVDYIREANEWMRALLATRQR